MWHHRNVYEVQHRPAERTGRGFARRYTAGDVLAIWILADLVDNKSVDLNLAATAAKHAGRHLVQRVDTDSDDWLIVNPSDPLTAGGTSGRTALDAVMVNNAPQDTVFAVKLSQFSDKLDAVLQATYEKATVGERRHA